MSITYFSNCTCNIFKYKYFASKLCNKKCLFKYLLNPIKRRYRLLLHVALTYLIMYPWMLNDSNDLVVH
ncbi:uncharacterized protein PHALS_14558 [Plasmopara halstedii]|uniref:Uncharacterized protein n=1 Tax=Plasmopara halstedii TaxID=4781 RepID=A0A0P1ALD3_PLAHL|nr:uncharacterized protein PHALS_14558 [Plasmopara halstedii]CEG41722.1 hypothetical protein PHALS_14558 [Plasmopara halstedii]|eukprot:XP_024578091.1 hypothetical protein PHALS_14558 [Plasmopara halstedii]